MTRAIRGVAALIFLAGAGVAATAAASDEDVRSAPAFSYREGKGATVTLVGLRPVPGRLGEADIKRNEGRTRIKVKVQQPLPHPQTLGSLYTAYLLWAIAPEGRVERLAELRHSQAYDVDVTTSFPSFGLVVTAEPHAGVLHPGALVVAENAGRADDDDNTRALGRVEFTPATEYRLPALGQAGITTPLPLLGARRAVEIARAAGAAEFAEAELREAEVKLAALEQIQSGKKSLSRDAESMARDVMRLAEEARASAVDRRQAAGLASERRAAQRAIASARDEAERQRATAQQEEENARRAREEAEARAEAQRQAQAQAAAAQAQAAAAESQAQQAQADADSARLQAEEVRRQNAELQDRLYQSISAVLETRREARGMIVNLSDVLFDTGKASLKPGAREKLSRLSGILLAYPGSYSIEVEGHTDSVGSEAYNDRLSLSRADSVRAYLQQSGIAPARFKLVTGYGEKEPVATNMNAAGRQMNRRVELVIADLDKP